MRSALDRFGQLDILINNAGILRDKTFAKLSPDDLDLVLDVHLKGAFYVSQPAFRAMKEHGYGRLLFTTSAAGLFGNFGQSNYAAAKMGLVGLCRVLSLEGAKYEIRANVIAPMALTRMTEGLLGKLGEQLDPAQVCALAAYLVSEECEQSHRIFSVGGGRIARVFIGLAEGWFAGRGQVPSVEEVRDHLDEILSTDEFIVPESVADETRKLVRLYRD